MNYHVNVSTIEYEQKSYRVDCESGTETLQTFDPGVLSESALRCLNYINCDLNFVSCRVRNGSFTCSFKSRFHSPLLNHSYLI